MNLFVIILAIIIGLILIEMCKNKARTYMNYGSFFCIIWSIVIAFSNSGLFEFVLPSSIVNVSMLIGLLVFGSLYFFFSSRRLVNESDVVYNSTVRINLIIIANVIVFFFMMPVFIKAIGVINSNGYMYLRSIAGIGSEELGVTSLKDVILQCICYPSTVATLLVGVRKIFLREKGSVIITVLAAVNLTIYCFAHAARNGFIFAIIIVVLTAIDNKIRSGKQAKQNKKRMGVFQKLLIVLLVVAAVYIVLYISGKRASGSNSLVENIYLYFFAGPSFLTRLLERYPQFLNGDELLYGAATFGFIFNLFSIPLNIIGFSLPNSDYIINSQLTSGSLNISNNVRVNAMSTVYFPWLVDWGYFGIILGPVFLAIATIYIEKKRWVQRNIRWDCIGVFWYYLLYRTIFKYDGISISFFFILFFIFWFTSKPRIHVALHQKRGI